MYAVWLIAPVEDSLDNRIFCVSVLSYTVGESRFVVTQLNPQTGKIATGDIDTFKTYDDLFEAYKKQMKYCIGLLVNADNAIDAAHAERCR